MRLDFGNFPVRELEFGDQTAWKEGVLTVDKNALLKEIAQLSAVEEVGLEIALPGESVRIIHLLDALEPRYKLNGSSAGFPGFRQDFQLMGEGRTHRLTGAAVLMSCEIPWKSLGGLLMVREGILEMSGEAAQYSPLSNCRNLVVTLKVKDGLQDEEYDEITRLATLKAGDHLAQAVAEIDPPEVETFELSDCANLPRIFYIDQIQSQGVWARTFLYGTPLDQLLPTVLHPNEILDGALVSGNQVYQCFKTPTWLHCNNPVLRQLYSRHGAELNFLGVILSRGHFYSIEEKQRSADLTARLAAMLRADGVVLTWEGGGNSIIDAMKTVQSCEEMGISTTVIAYELAGQHGDQDPLLYAESRADAIVSTGNTDQAIRLPRVDRVVGGSEIRLKPEVGGLRLPADGEIELENVHELYGAAGQVGAGHMTTEEF